MSLRVKEEILVFFICLTGLVLRLLGLVNITLAGDFAYHWHVAGEIIKGVSPLLGPSASVNSSFHLGPLYYYFLAIPYGLGNGNFHAAIIFFSLINTVSIYLLYKVCKQWLSTSSALKVTTLFACSNYIITIQNFPWNPYLLPLGIILCLFCLARIQKSHYSFIPLLFLVLGLCLQLHATAIFLLPVFLLVLLRNNIPKKFYLAGIILFLLTLVPWIYADVTTHFSQTRAALAIFQPGTTSHCSFTHYLHNHGHGERCFAYIRNSLFVFRLFTQSLFSTQNLFVVLVTMLTTLALLLRNNLQQKKLFLLWIGVPWFLFLFYANNTYLHYFLILIPLPFILVVLLLEKLKIYGIWGNISSKLFFLALLSLNIAEYLLSLQKLRG